MKTSLPRVTPYEVYYDRKGRRTVMIICPFCGKSHVHGWPAGQATPPGSRVPHCTKYPKDLSGYYITLPTVTTYEKRPPARTRGGDAA